MYPYLGDFPTGATIFVPFQTFNSSGASVTITGLAVTDIEVYKGASMTQRASDAGYALVDTDGIDLDTITGIHGFTIDTSDNTDAGFYAAGSDYTVVVSAITVDSQTVNFIAARFSIDNRGLLRPTTAGRTLDVTTTGEAGVDFDNVLFAGNGPIPAFGLIDRGTAQAADANGITLRAGFSTAAANMVGVTAWIYSSTNGLHARGLSTAYNDTTKVLTLSGLGEAPTGTVLYALFATAPGSALSVNLEDNAITAAKIATGAFTAAKFAAGAIDAAAIATDAFTAAKFAADVTTEFQNGLATAAALATVDGNVDAILLDTAEIGAAGAGLTALASAADLATVAGYLDTEIAAILALLDDPRTEPGQGAPPVNPDLATKIDYLYKAWRNRSTQTATEYALYADDGTTKDHEAACSDDGTTFVRSEVTTGA